MNLIIKPYDFQPCELEVFEINGIKAYKEDFGENKRVDDDEEDIDYVCYGKFEANRKKDESILSKYKISFEEYLEICDKLELELLAVGCGMCL